MQFRGQGAMVTLSLDNLLNWVACPGAPVPKSLTSLGPWRLEASARRRQGLESPMRMGVDTLTLLSHESRLPPRQPGPGRVAVRLSDPGALSQSAREGGDARAPTIELRRWKTCPGGQSMAARYPHGRRAEKHGVTR